MAQAFIIFDENSHHEIHKISVSRPRDLRSILSLCKLYHGEGSNPYDVDSPDREERMVQFLKYHLFDAEKDLSDNPTRWKYLLLQERGGAFTSEQHLAKLLYDFCIGKKLSMMKDSTGYDFRPLMEKMSRTLV